MGTLKVVYPAYFDRSLSRRGGRRVKNELSVENVKLEDLVRVVKRLKLTYTEEKGHAYSRRWWLKEGRLLINTSMPKEELLRMIARGLREDLGARTGEPHQ
jgi:signal recognition particle subunit SRP19